MGISRAYLLKVLLLLLVVGAVFFYFYRPQTGRRIHSAPQRVDGFHQNAEERHEKFAPDRLSNFDFFTSKNEEKEEKVHLDNAIDVAMSFSKAKGNAALKGKFTLCISSLLQYTSRPIHLRLIGDKASIIIAKKIISRQKYIKPSPTIKVSVYDAEIIGAKTDIYIGDIQKYFIYKPGAYYSDSLFFYSIVLHKIFPVSRLIVLDADLKFQGDIADLQQHFDKFSPENVIGIAREQQPVYRHIFHMYRKDHENTLVGEPPPNGIPGFNSAVILLDLQRMRNSQEYRNLLNATVIANLVAKYKFQGHLGDQDFFTLISLENLNLFYTLPCGWNRQLCEWWKLHGYKDVFDQYHKCNEDINIMHGNCNTPIPK